MVYHYLIEGDIKLNKNGMTTEEIATFLDKKLENRMEEGLEFLNRLWFRRDEKEKNYKVELLGFGYGIPTPRLILKIKDKKLSSWKKIER